MIGTTIGKYRIVGPLGRGATGIVYKAIDETLEREVAIKILNPDLADTDIVKRFRAEATILAKLNHPEIATIHELVQRERDFLMVMELVRGETLERLCERAGPLAPDRAAWLVDRILSALGYAHRAGVVHRDVKPANVMVTDLGGVKIMDFGIARIRGAEHMTVDGCTIGTPAYMPPEQVLGEEVDGRSDLYSVGVILYRLFTGKLPFEADTPMGMLHKQMANTPPPLSVHRPDLPDWCDSVVQRALAKSPSERYQSTDEFRAALAAANGIRHVELGAVGIPAVVTTTPRSVGPAPAQTIAVSPREMGVRSASDEPASGAKGKAFLQTIVGAARAREGTLLALFILLGAMAYLALGGSADLSIPMRSANASSVPTVVFQTKALVGTGAKQRERDAQLVLDERGVTVSAGAAQEPPLYSVAYRDVLSVSWSRGRDPMWKSPKGPARVVRFSGGTLGSFGIFVDREWISLETASDNNFIVLRVEGGVAKPILAALEERTGHAPAMLGR